MSHKLTRVYDQRAGGTLTAEGPTGVVQPLPAQVQVYWARLHLAEIIRCVRGAEFGHLDTTWLVVAVLLSGESLTASAGPPTSVHALIQTFWYSIRRGICISRAASRPRNIRPLDRLVQARSILFSCDSAQAQSLLVPLPPCWRQVGLAAELRASHHRLTGRCRLDWAC